MTSLVVLAFSLILVVNAGAPPAPQPSPSPAQAGQKQIPEASLPCAPEVAAWWEEVRAAGHAAAEARLRKWQAVRDARATPRPRGPTIENDDDVLPRNQREKLNTAIADAMTRYIELLKLGSEKSYAAPIPDARRPIFLYVGRPSYSEQGRAEKVSGAVKLRVEFRADGTVGEITVVSGLGYGLDENAIKAAREAVFLPAVSNSAFVPFTTPVDVSFAIK